MYLGMDALDPLKWAVRCFVGMQHINRAWPAHRAWPRQTPACVAKLWNLALQPTHTTHPAHDLSVSRAAGLLAPFPHVTRRPSCPRPHSTTPLNTAQAARPARVLWLVVVLTVVLVAARALVVVVFAMAHNVWCAPEARLARRDVVAVWWAGLMRGAVSVALAYTYWDDDPRQMPDAGRATLIVSTLMVRPAIQRTM